MDVVDLLPNLRMLRFPVGQAYLWRDPDSLTLIDTGLAGAGPDISRAVTGFGLKPTDLDRVVLTHFHEDHTCSAAEVGGWDDGDVLPFGGGAHVLAVPGHTDGSIAIYLPQSGVLFTGDSVAADRNGHVILGPFNVSRAEAVRSFRRLAAVDSATAVFGHGDPVLIDAATVLREASRHLPRDQR